MGGDRRLLNMQQYFPLMLAPKDNNSSLEKTQFTVIIHYGKMLSQCAD
jgi:hypothetical protein